LWVIIEDAAYAWRNFARRWKNESDGIILAVGGGAMGVRLGTPAEYASKMPDVDINEPSDDEDEYHVLQLIGCQAVLENGEIFGEVSDVINLPGQDLLAIKTSNGEQLIPFVHQLVSNCRYCQ